MRPVAVVILAAGASTRLGRPKQLLPFQGRTLLRHAAETALASNAQNVVLVLGANGEKMREEVESLSLEIVENADWQAGMGTSIRAGLAAALTNNPGIEAALFMLCDQPFVTANLLNQIIEKHNQHENAVIASAYGEETGVPALFPRSFFEELVALPDEAGAKRLLTRHAAHVVAVDFPAGVQDVDTEEDYRLLLQNVAE